VLEHRPDSFRVVMSDGKALQQQLSAVDDERSIRYSRDAVLKIHLVDDRVKRSKQQGSIKILLYGDHP